MENLKIDPSPKNSSLKMIGPKDASSSDATSCISSGDAASSSKESENNHEASANDASMYYYGYCYPGFNGLASEWDPHNFFMGPAGFKIQPPAGKDENGSLVYCVPGIQSGYIPYSPFFPGAVVGVDSQYIVHQSYDPNAVSPQPLAISGVYPHPFAYATEMLPSYPLEPSFVFLDGFQGNRVNFDSTDAHQKTRSSFQHHKITSKTLPASMSASVLKGSTQASDVQNQSGKLVNKGKNGFLYQNNQANNLDNSYSWSADEKLKAHNLNGQSDFDLLHDQNLGPRKNASKSSSESEVSLADAPITGKNDDGSGSVAIIKKNDYNHLDFVTKYEHAFFFVIKSFSEDDIHKSIKYNVWTSTQNGNKRLDSAFQAGQEKTAENGNKCPVFLFFSVNASGQFCGVAEMVGRVDFSKNMDFWQQDKWNGYFPVKWHLVKDVPNSGLRHIILENNDNKPVTNSRDTQEVKFPQGIEMLNIFKNYSSKTSILDDFDFYEERQKVMQDKRKKQPSNLFYLLPKVPSEVIQDAKVTAPRR